MDRAAIERSFASHVEYTLAKDEYSVTPRDFYRAIALSVRDRIADRWNKTQQQTFRGAERRVYYLSLEYLVGRLLEDSMLNLGVTGEARAALADLGIDLTGLVQYEDDAGSATAGSGGSRRASSTRWRRSASPPSATASATSTAFTVSGPTSEPRRCSTPRGRCTSGSGRTTRSTTSRSPTSTATCWSTRARQRQRRGPAELHGLRAGEDDRPRAARVLTDRDRRV